MALVKYIAEPGLDIRLAFGRVRDDVLKSTSNRQEPFVYGSLGGETTALVPAVAKPVDPEAQARIDYELAAQVGTKDAWDSFIASHNSGYYARLARAQNDKLSAAQKTRAKADDTRREAEEEVAQKANEFRRRLEEQTSRQTAEVKQRLSEQAQKISKTRGVSFQIRPRRSSTKPGAKWSSPSSRRRPHDSRSRKPGVRRSPTLSSRSNKPSAWPRRKRPSSLR